MIKVEKSRNPLMPKVDPFVFEVPETVLKANLLWDDKARRTK